MPTYTERLKIPLPLGTEVFNRENYIAALQAVEDNAAAAQVINNFSIGRKIGLEIYYNGSDDIRIRKGIIHVNDGTDHLITKTTETELTGESSLTGWNFVTINNEGIIQLQAATGTDAQRPTNTFYQFGNYNQDKHGYYYNENERIIGAIFRIDATNWYIINNFEGQNEEGQNEYGFWEINGGRLRQHGTHTFTTTIAKSSGSLYYGGPTTITFPVDASVDTPKVSFSGASATAAPFWVVNQAPPTSASVDIYLFKSLSDTASRDRLIDFQAESAFNPF
jgi:hypothetical protein